MILSYSEKFRAREGGRARFGSLSGSGPAIDARAALRDVRPSSGPPQPGHALPLSGWPPWRLPSTVGPAVLPRKELSPAGLEEET